VCGAEPAPRLSGREALPSKTHYFIGQDPAAWADPGAELRAGRVPRGISRREPDLLRNQRQLEYDFGGGSRGLNPEVIRLGFEGAEAVELSAEGDLVLRTPGGRAAVPQAARLYQETGHGRHPVRGDRDVLWGKAQVGFQVNDYDRAARWLLIRY